MEAEKAMKRCMDMAMRNQRIIPVQEMLYGDDGLELAEYDRIRQQGHKGPMFGLRLAISLILFACVIYLDKNQIDWKGQSAVAVINRQLETSVIGNSTVEALH